MSHAWTRSFAQRLPRCGFRLLGNIGSKLYRRQEKSLAVYSAEAVQVKGLNVTFRQSAGLLLGKRIIR